MRQLRRARVAQREADLAVTRCRPAGPGTRASDRRPGRVERPQPGSPWSCRAGRRGRARGRGRRRWSSWRRWRRASRRRSWSGRRGRAAGAAARGEERASGDEHRRHESAASRCSARLMTWRVRAWLASAPSPCDSPAGACHYHGRTMDRSEKLRQTQRPPEGACRLRTGRAVAAVLGAAARCRLRDRARSSRSPSRSRSGRTGCCRARGRAADRARHASRPHPKVAQLAGAQRAWRSG